MSKQQQLDSDPDSLAARKKLTFEQAEGLEPLPSQLKRGEISKEFRAIVWDVLRGHPEGLGREPINLPGGRLARVR